MCPMSSRCSIRGCRMAPSRRGVAARQPGRDHAGIRKFQAQTFTAEQLVRLGTLTPEQLTVLRQAIEVRANILISGGTGTGKTTLLNALTAFLPAHDRLVLIEDTAELQLDTPNLVRFEARRERPACQPSRFATCCGRRSGTGRTASSSARYAGGEAFDLLQALNTGHSGTLSTIHANSADQALRRFTSCVSPVRRRLALHRHSPRHRRVRPAARAPRTAADAPARRPELVHVRGYDPESDRYDLRCE